MFLKYKYYTVLPVLLLMAGESRGEKPVYSTFEDDSFAIPKKEVFRKENPPENLKTIFEKSKDPKFADYALTMKAYQFMDGNFQFLKANSNSRLISVSFAPRNPQISMKKYQDTESYDIKILENPGGTFQNFNIASSGGAFKMISSEKEAGELALFFLRRELAENPVLSEFSGTCILIPSLEEFRSLKKELEKQYSSEIQESKGEPTIGISRQDANFRVDLLYYRNLEFINRSYLIMMDNRFGIKENIRLRASFAKELNMINAPAESYETESFIKIQKYDQFIKNRLKNTGRILSNSNIRFLQTGEKYPGGAKIKKDADLILTEDSAWKSPFQ